ncbi:hypothetical protein V8F20_000061 [Naviculisporaceae sp. PSN 640]
MSSTTDPIPPNTPGMIAPKPIPTPTHGNGGAGSFSVGCSTTVAAAPLICLDVVLNSSKYPEWNRFCRQCTIDSQPKQTTTKKQQEDDALSRHNTTTSVALPDLGEHYLKLGTKFTFDVHMDPDDGKPIGSGRPTQLEVSVLEPINEVVPVEQSSPSTSPSRRSSPRSSVISTSGGGGGGDPAGDGPVTSGLGLGHRRRKSNMSASSNTSRSSRRKYVRRTGWRVAWKTRPSALLPGWMLRSERVQEFVQIDPAPFGPRDEIQTAYACWETFYGVLAPVVRLSVGLQLVKGFGTWMEDMKARAEELERTEGAFAPVG